MPYTPPAGNAVNLNFTGAYTPPLGGAVNLNFTSGGYTFNLDPGSYVISGTGVTLRYGRRLILASGSYVISGTVVALRRGYSISAAPGVYSISGAAVSLLVSRYLPAAPGVYAISGTAVSLRFGHLLTAAPGTYVLSGSAVALRYGHAINAVPGVYAITGIGPTLLWKHILRATPGVYALTGSSVSLRYGRQINAVAGVYQLNGKSVFFDYHEVTKLSADPGIYALTGGDVTMTLARRMVVAPGTYLIQGHAPDLRAALILSATPGVYSITGQSVTLSQGGRTLGADSGVYRLIGGDVTMTVARRVSLAGGVYALTGAATQLLAARRMTFGSGAYTIVDTPNFTTDYTENSQLTNNADGWNSDEVYNELPSVVRAATGVPSLPFAFQQLDPNRDGFVRWGAGRLPLPDNIYDFELSFKVKPGASGQEFVINVFWFDAVDGHFMSAGEGILAFPTDTTQFTQYSTSIVRPVGAGYYVIEAKANDALATIGYIGDIRFQSFSPMSVTIGRRLTLGSGVYALNGSAMSTLRNYEIRAVPGVYTLNGSAVSVAMTRAMLIEAGVYRLQGQDVSLTPTWRPRGPRAIAVGSPDSRYLAVEPQSRRLAVEPQSRRITVEPAPRRYAAVEPRDKEPVGGSMLTWPSKDPNEVLDYELDWADPEEPRLETGETLLTSVWSVVLGDVVIDVGLTNFTPQGLSTVWLSGGSPATKCELLNRVTTSMGRTYDKTAVLRIRDH